MSKVKIYGNLNPVIGIKEYYSIHDFLGSSAPSKFIDSLENIPDENIKWSVWILLGDTWTKMTKNNKTGATVDYTFTQVSLKRKGIRMLVDANGEKAILDIKTQKNAESKILYVEILDNNGKKPTKLFMYGETITARVHCLNMEKFRINVTLWENDGGKKDLSDISIDTKETNVLNGKADVKFTFDTSKVWLANAKSAPNESNEGAFHEYYITAEFYKKISKPTPDINVINPDYKVDILSKVPASKPSETDTTKTSPAQEKGSSKKETRGIVKKDQKAHDYHEEKVDVQPTINYNPEQEFVNSLMMVDVGDSIWNQKKSDCFCNKDFEEKDVKKLVKLLKGSEIIWEGIALRGGGRMECNINDKTFSTLTKSLNESFKKYHINTCIQKIHFLAQVCEETGNFALSEEIRGQHASSQSVYKGRGLLQLTGVRKRGEELYDEAGPYQIYADYRKNQEIVSKPEIIANNVDYCIDSGAWVWSINKKMTSDPQSDAISRWGKETLGKSLNELAVFEGKYFELISVLLNGRGSNGMPNNYLKRQNNYNLLKTFFFMYDRFHGTNFKQVKATDIVTYHIYANGEIEKHFPAEIKEEYKDKYKYVYYDKNSNEHEICTVKFTSVQKWIVGSRENGGSGWERRIADGKTRYYQKGNGQTELIKINLPINYNMNGVIIKLGDNTDREYINPKAFASLLGAIAECGYSDFKFNGSTSSDGTGAPSVTHVNGLSFDFRYLRKDKTGNNLNINTDPNLLDIERQEKFIDALVKFGYSKFYSYNIIINNRNFILKNSTHLAEHDHHLHVRREGYNPNFKEVK